MTPWVGRLALRLGAVDEPGGRHIHQKQTPSMGGIAIALGSLIGVLAVIYVPGIGKAGLASLLIVFIAAGGILLLGIVDDWRTVKPRTKLLIQLLLALACWQGGVRIDFINTPAGGQIWFADAGSLILTVGWILGVTNAINLLDGLDGLASGVVAIVAATLILVGLAGVEPDVFLVLTTGALGGACMGFLLHNRHPARIFMGDSGSLFLGFLLANLVLLTMQKRTFAMALGVPIMMLGVPLMDTAIAILRRLLGRRSLFASDTKHVHHLLLKQTGLRSRLAVGLILCETGLLCLFALLGVLVDARLLWLGSATLVVSLLALYAVNLRTLREVPPKKAKAPAVSEDVQRLPQFGPQNQAPTVLRSWRPD